MRIGTSLALVAVGLILAYAVDFELPGIDVGALGAILFYVGMLGLLVTVGLEVLSSRARRPRSRRTPDLPTAPRAPAARPYDPVIPARRPVDPSSEPTQVLRQPGEDETRRLPRR